MLSSVLAYVNFKILFPIVAYTFTCLRSFSCRLYVKRGHKAEIVQYSHPRSSVLTSLLIVLWFCKTGTFMFEKFISSGVKTWLSFTNLLTCIL